MSPQVPVPSRQKPSTPSRETPFAFAGEPRREGMLSLGAEAVILTGLMAFMLVLAALQLPEPQHPADAPQAHARPHRNENRLALVTATDASSCRS